MCTNGGIFLFTVFDKRCTSSLLFVCLLEVVHVVWFYGADNFFDNLAEMDMDLNRGFRLESAFHISMTFLLAITSIATRAHMYSRTVITVFCQKAQNHEISKRLEIRVKLCLIIW